MKKVLMYFLLIVLIAAGILVWPVKEGTPDMRSIDNDDYKSLLIRCCLYTAGLM